jgi:predicted nucleotidyltransferase component of viral defense system
MPKRPLTASEQFDLRQTLHVATLDALMASRRWEPGELVFQGGTSLHLAHGSPRFSEDLDFLVDSSLKLGSISDAVEQRLSGSAWLPQGTELAVKKAKAEHNPHTFQISIGGPEILGAVRVKVELWQTPPQALHAVGATVTPVRVTTGPSGGAQAFVPTADLPEILADKVFALAARPYLKPRDVFDLHWLAEHSGLVMCTEEDLRIRLDTYPNTKPQAWLEQAQARREYLATALPEIKTDLQRWLPTSWPLTDDKVQAMIRNAHEALSNGIELMADIARQHDHDTPHP